MNFVLRSFVFFSIALLISCGGKQEKKEQQIKLKSGDNETQVSTKKKSEETAIIDLDNKGIGPIEELKLPESIDQEMAELGEDLFKSDCAACHKPTKRFIAPPVAGLLDRRSPEWIMNMILNPEEMTEKDPIAAALFIEYNGAPMINQGLSEIEARAVLEYIRTIRPD